MTSLRLLRSALEAMRTLSPHSIFWKLPKAYVHSHTELLPHARHSSDVSSFWVVIQKKGYRFNLTTDVRPKHDFPRKLSVRSVGRTCVTSSSGAGACSQMFRVSTSPSDEPETRRYVPCIPPKSKDHRRSHSSPGHGETISRVISCSTRLSKLHPY